MPSFRSHTLEEDDHGGYVQARSLRSVSSGMFVDQPESSLERSTGSPSPDFAWSHLPTSNEIGGLYNPIVIDDDDQDGVEVGVSQNHEVSSSSDEGEEEGEESENSNEPSNVADVDDQKPLQEIHQANPENLGDDTGRDPSPNEEGAAEDNAEDDYGTSCVSCSGLKGGLQERETLLRRVIQSNKSLRERIRQLLRQIRQLEEGHDRHLEEDRDPRRRRSNNNYLPLHLPIPAGPGRHGGKRTWHALLREAILDPDSKSVWKAAQRMCAREENYSLRQLHPHIIRLVGHRTTTKAGHDLGPVGNDSSREAASTARSTSSKRFKRAFPDEITSQILRELLVFDGQLIFVFSRLDPFALPASFPKEDSDSLTRSSGLKGRFYISEGEPCEMSLTHDTISPGELLAPLCVSRKWGYYGASQFYGNNTFAFSSFGEFHKFCNGIGPARVQRIAHFELNWAGGSSLRWEDDANPSNRLDTRVAPLSWLAEMRRLQTLCIFIDESSKKAVRRPNEPEGLKKYARKMTAGQPNARMYRSIRASRGMDWVFNLRGLSYVRLYDSAKILATRDRDRSAVRDQSAVIDINRTASMAKTAARAIQATIPKLEPLFRQAPGKWEPGREAFSIVQQIYDQSGPFDLRRNDLDINYDPRYGTPSGSGDEPGDGEEEGEEDSSDGSGSDGGSSASSGSHTSMPKRGRDVQVDGEPGEPDEGARKRLRTSSSGAVPRAEIPD